MSILEELRKWKIQRRTIYALGAAAILFNETFVAKEPRTPLLGVALVLLGLIPADIKDARRQEKDH